MGPNISVLKKVRKSASLTDMYRAEKQYLVEYIDNQGVLRNELVVATNPEQALEITKEKMRG